jgi:uncharacterized membrane protein
MTRRGLTAALAALCALGWASSAQAFTLDGARVQAQVGPDGSVLVREQITISGAFHGAYRDIPVAPGQVVDNVVVSEDGRPYGLGGSTELGSIGQPDQYATTRSGDDLRVVWHFDDPGGDPRTFTVEYRFRGLTVAYSDVVDLNYRVWGDQWSASLPRLDAVVLLPGRAEGSAYRAWAGPGWVPGYVTRGPDRVTLVAGPVPAHQFVDLRIAFPRALLRATTGAQERSGPGLSRIESEVAASIHQAEDGRRHLREWKARWPLTVVLLLLLGLGPGLAVVAYVYWRLGREPRVDYDREYEQEPPSDLAPALVPPLVREQTGVGPAEFTATLFDLIRRGAYKATQVTTEESHWAGLSKHSVADLEVQAGDKRNDLTDFESAVVEIVDGVVGDSGERLSRFRARIEERRQENAELFADFKSQVSDEIRTRQWYRDTGRLVLGAALALFGVAGALLLFAGVQGLEPELLWSKILMITFGACLVTSSLVCGAGFLRTPLWRQRTAEAELEARRWDAFRRYLTDFPRLGEAAPATLVLWERYLVYGIAFGIAERVLQAAHLQMPEALHDQSSIFWISGAYGAGPSQLGIGDLSAGFGSALAPPSGSSGSGAGGFGGSFGGGGFGGGGGGGGGGW